MSQRAVFASAAMLLLAGAAYAGPVFVGTTTLNKSYGTDISGGGEMQATTAGLSISVRSLGEVAGKFETFCLEEHELISFDVPFKADLNDRSVADGSAASPYFPNNFGGIQDPVSDATAYLYSQFIQGTLAGYHYANGTQAEKDARAQDALAVQQAIWVLENERAALDAGVNSSFLNLAILAVTVGGYKNNGVAALNLYYNNTAGGRVDRQDILVMVPLPAASFAGLTTLGGLALIRRRRA